MEKSRKIAVAGWRRRDLKIESPNENEKNSPLKTDI